MEIGQTIYVTEPESDSKDLAKKGDLITKRKGKIVAMYPHYIVVAFRAALKPEHAKEHPTYRKSYLRVDIKYNLGWVFEICS